MKIFKNINAKEYLNFLGLEPIYSKEVEDIEKEMNNIYENREKYSLKWAYEHAHDLIDVFLNEKIFSKKEDIIVNMEEEKKERIMNIISKIERFISKALNNYKRINFVITFFEFLVSVLLILSVHNITEMAIHRYSEYLNVGLIILAFALFKVFVENKFLRPMFEKRGWAIYKKNIPIIKEKLAQACTIFTTVKEIHCKKNNIIEKNTGDLKK